MFLGLPELSNVYSTHHDDSSSATETQDAVTEAAGSSSQRQDPGEGMSPPVGQALGKWYREGKYVPAVWSHHQRQGRNHGNQQVHEEKRHSSQKVEGRTELDLVQVEVDEAKRLLEGDHVEVQAAQNKATEAAFRLGQAMEEMAQIGKLLGGESGAIRARKMGQKKRLLVGIKRTRTMWGKTVRAVNEEERLQNSKDITAQCIDVCEATTSEVHAVLRHAPADLRGGTLLQHPRVLVATVACQENPHLCLQILRPARFQVFRGAYILLRASAVALSQEAQGLLEEIRLQPNVFVLSGPAIVITNVATASVCF